MNEHLHGDTENNGLVSQLRQRMVTLRRLARYMFKNKLEMMVSDNFSLKLMNCSPFFINVPCQDQGCTKSGILVTGLPAKQRFGSQFTARLNNQPAKINSQQPKKTHIQQTSLTTAS